MTTPNESMRVALISGGASGIGLATAEILAARHHHVYLADINMDLAKQQAARLCDEGFKASAVALDLTQEANWQTAMADVEAQHGRLDVLVNNAGIGVGGTIESTSLADFQLSMSVNVNGVFLGCKYGIPLMEKNGGGAVINISSIFGIVSDQLVVAYSASKGAVRSMTKSIALDCAARKNGVRVNSVHPGFVETPMVAGAAEQLPEDILTDYMQRTVGLTPMGRFGQPNEIGEVIAFLASPQSSFMTGAELVVDGGFTAR